MKSINILDKDYSGWLSELSSRYRQSQIKAAIKVNQEMLRFYWELGRDIVERDAENKYGSGFYTTLSKDLKYIMPNATGLSETAIRYSKRFFELYNQIIINLPQVEEIFKTGNLPQLGEESPQMATMKIMNDLFSVPWGHHKYIIDRCSKNPAKALFFVRQTVENGWSRNMLLNFLDTDLFERQGKAITNFTRTLPDETSDLAQEITRDPYDFAFTGIIGQYNERLLKDKLLNNITNFLIELGTGFAYVGKEYRLEIGETENFIDLLFYNLKLRCYVVVEVKTGKFESKDIGQLGTYMVAVDHTLCSKFDNKTIGLLICKSKDAVMARYALESSTQPIGISEYELEKFYPEKIEGTIPTIEEIETKLTELIKSEE